MRHRKLYTLDQLEAAAARFMAEAKARHEIRSALCGGLAMQFYGSDRLTADIDIAAVGWLPWPNPQSTLSFGGQAFVLVYEGQEVSLDWIVRADDYEALYDEAILTAADSGHGYAVVRPEYLVVMKLAAGRPKDNEDALFLLREKDVHLDRGEARRIMKKFCGQYGAEDFDQVCEEADFRDQIASKYFQRKPPEEP